MTAQAPLSILHADSKTCFRLPSNRAVDANADMVLGASSDNQAHCQSWRIVYLLCRSWRLRSWDQRGFGNGANV